VRGAAPAATDWRPTAGRRALELRAGLLARVREFFAERGVLEVDTPVLSQGATTDPQIASLRTDVRGAGVRYLQTSPEFAMKRLLAAGSGDIYQLCRVFRDGERGRHHNVEFTLLEWYRTGFDHHALMDEVADLLRAVLGAERVDPVERMSFRAAVERHAGLDPFAAGADDCAACLARAGVAVPSACGRDELLDLIAGEIVGPRLGRAGAAFVFDYPASRAALARLRAGDPPVAERFELYLDGIELANGFHELADAKEQRVRFERDLRARADVVAAAVPVDERLLAALEAGLPACAGVALGFDRLVMLAAGAARIDEVIAFPIERA
jgi:lysyl-tRNA synthetase class 2